MLNSVTAKTVWERKRSSLIIVIVAFIGLVALIILSQRASVPQLHDKKYPLSFKNTPARFSVVKAVTDAQQSKGLGGVKAMAADQGMLFVYNQPERQCFWMKNMRFSLDILWLDQDKHITHLEQAVPANSYPKQYCAAGQYVLELNAGAVQKAQLRTGQQAIF